MIKEVSRLPVYVSKWITRYSQVYIIFKSQNEEDELYYVINILSRYNNTHNHNFYEINITCPFHVLIKFLKDTW